MPISREEFESSLDRLAFLVLDFLRENADAAFTSAEIAAELARIGVESDESVLNETLRDLASRQRVETSTREGEVYYAYRRWIGFRR